MPSSSHFRLSHVPPGKEDDAEYWRNRAIMSEVEIYALRRNLIEAASHPDITLWQCILRRLSLGS